MEQINKRKMAVEIAGVHLTLVTDESDSFVEAVVSQVDERMESMLNVGIRTGTSTLDAALLCALDAVSERLKAEKRVRTLEAQIALYEANLRSLKEELDGLRTAPVAEEGKPSETDESFERLSQTLRAGAGDEAEDKIKTLERYLDSKKSGANGGMSRAEKIKYIESLLRGN